jgi:hypothetical protein
MQNIMRILAVILILALLFLGARGLGLANVFKRNKPAKKTLMLDDFEKNRNLDDDVNLGWTTDGYVNIVASTEKMTHGKRSAMAVFLPENQFAPVPTPGINWAPQMILDTHSVKEFTYPEYEWQDYASVKIDVYNPQDRPVTYKIQIVDSHSYTYEKSGPLTVSVFNNLEIPITDLAAERLDTADIWSFRFGADMSGTTTPVTLFLDNLRLEGEAPLPGKMAQPPKALTTPQR